MIHNKTHLAVVFVQNIFFFVEQNQ